jgi:hypothetical protein
MTKPAKPKFVKKFNPKTGKITGSRSEQGRQSNELARSRYASDNRTIAEKLAGKPTPMVGKPTKAGTVGNPFKGGVLPFLDPLKWMGSNKGKRP